MLNRLNLPDYQTRIRQDHEDRLDIFDPVRRKFVRLTPEEWVRQHMLNFLIHHRGYPAGLIAIEAPHVYDRRKKRSDIMVYSRNGSPLLIVECKAPEIELTQEVFDQVAIYNFNLKVDYLMITNGIHHYTCNIDHAAGTFSFLEGIPSYEELIISSK